ncbi:MAG: FAD-dependent monooxygenase, partial [Burkholderiales bacterium]|nr:FAD-dependent monooxygenase [Burkholderiales bacterium]
MGRDTLCVVGRGPIGAAVALGAGRAGLDVVQLVAPTTADPGPARALALSPGTLRFLDALGVAARLPAASMASYTGMRVVADDGRATLEFDAADAGESELGRIVDGDALDHAFDQALRGEARVETRVGTPLRMRVDRDSARIDLADGRTVDAALVVAADGAQSWVRRQCGLRVRERDYRQHAVTVRFACERPHDGIARQWFRGDGVLALLPQAGDHVALVWSTDPAHADVLVADPQALAAQATDASGAALGALSIAGPVGRFPLSAHVASRWTAPRAVLVGDAAHRFHPLAGQGANVGFRDARSLVDVLATRAAGTDPGDAR